MQAIKFDGKQRVTSVILSALLAFPTFALAQEPPAPPPPPSDVQAAPPQAPTPAPESTGGWKRVGDQSGPQQQQAPPPPVVDPNSVPVQDAPPPPPPQQQQQQAPPPQQQQPYPPYGQQPGYGYPQQQQNYPPQGYPQQQQAPPPVAAMLTVPAGTFLTVRINQMLSSDRNHEGDAFSATLSKPVVVNGVVVAEPGQTVAGHVVEAVKAGRVEGVAKLGVQLTDLTLVDGQQMPIKSSLVSRTGPSSVGQDAGTIIGATGLGAAVGAAAAWGKGAAIGAGSGLPTRLVGVLVTRGHPSILYPEQMLTFRIEAPVTIETDHSPQAFRYIEPGEYGQTAYGPPQGAYGPGPYAASLRCPSAWRVSGSLLLRLPVSLLCVSVIPAIGDRDSHSGWA